MNHKLLDLKRALVASFIVASSTAGSAGAVSPVDPAAGEKDALRATLIESREKSRGVTLYAAGASIAMVVTSVDGTYVIGRNQASSRIVVRLDRIDGVSAAF